MSQIQSVSEFLSMLRRRAWLILLVAIAGTLFSVWFALQQPRLYQSTAVIQIETPHVAEGVAGTASTDAQRRLQLIEQRIMSRDNLIAMIDRFQLFADAPGISINDRIFRLRVSTDITQIIDANAQWQAGAVPSGLSITVRYGDAQTAADLANAFARDAVDLNRERRTAAAEDTLAFFANEEATLTGKIDALDATIAAFKRENGQSLPDNLPALRSQLATLKDSELQLDQQILTLETGTNRSRTAVVEQQLNLLNDQKGLLADRISGIEGALAAAPAVERQLNVLEREMQKLQDQYSVITRRKAEAQMGQVLEERQQTERLEILDPALPGEYPISASRKKLALAGAVASVLAGLGLAFLLEVFNPVIRSAAQLERALDVSPVVSIPEVATRGERRWRRSNWIGLVLIALAGLPLVLKALAERLGALRAIGGN